MAQIIWELTGEILLISSSKRSREGGPVLPNQGAPVKGLEVLGEFFSLLLLLVRL